MIIRAKGKLMESGHTVAVFGAYGHTGRFVVTELRDRGFVPLISGRDPDKLRALAASHPGLGASPASIDNPDSLDRALDGAAAVINCAGPFAATAAPVIEAALRAGIPYVDVSAEIEANIDTFTHFADRARAAGTVVVPAMAFYGGLGDLLATTAMGDWTAADEVHIAYGLSSWHPTAGTRAAGKVSRQRRAGRRVRYTNGQLEYRDDAPPAMKWSFPAPVGPRTVIGEFTMTDVVTIPSHLSVPEVRTYMTAEAARDVSAPDTPAPAAADERGRSAQTFLVDVIVRRGGTQRRAVASGQDIYAITAPLAVEAVHRILTGQARRTGVASAGEIFDAPGFLRALSAHISLEPCRQDYPRQPSRPVALRLQGADPVDDGCEGIQVRLVDGVVGEAVPVAVADDLLSDLPGRTDEEERVHQDLLGGHGAAVPLRQAGRRRPAVVRHRHGLGQRVPFDGVRACPGAGAGKAHAVVGFGRGAQPEYARRLSLELEEAADADDVGGDPQDAVPGAAHRQRRPVSAEAMALHGQQRRKAQPLAQLCLLLISVAGEQAVQLADRGRQLARACAMRFPGDAGLVELPLHVAGPEADLKPAAGEDVSGRDLTGEQCRIPERHVDHQRADAQPLGRGGRRDYRLERGRVP